MAADPNCFSLTTNGSLMSLLSRSTTGMCAAHPPGQNCPPALPQAHRQLFLPAKATKRRPVRPAEHIPPAPTTSRLQPPPPTCRQGCQTTTIPDTERRATSLPVRLELS